MLMTLLLGILAFVAWACAMGVQARSIDLLRISSLYFGFGSLLLAFPIVVMDVAITDSGYPVLNSWVMLLVFVFSEEILKILASRSQTNPTDSFAIVTLFGIYELLISKPFVMTFNGDWSIGLNTGALLALPSLAFHSLTAAIYAFVGRDKPVSQLATCIGLHTALNAFASGLIFPTVPLWWFVLLFIPLAVITVLLWRRRISHPLNLGAQVRN